MNEEKFCKGCGVKLQDSNVLFEGFTSTLSNDFCSRCFRLINYGEYVVTAKSNDEYIEILKSVNDTKDLVLYVVDLLNIEKDITMIRNYINNRLILVLTKRDVLPLSVNDEKIKDYFKNLGLDYQDIIIISSKKNYNVDELYKLIKLNKSSRNVYVVGHTNTGKSTLIKKMIENYSDNECSLAVSPLPSTTLNKISIKLSDDLELIDTPGLVDRGNIVNYVDVEILKKINAKKEIKPITHQIKEGNSIIISPLVRIDYKEGDKNSFTFYVSNELDVEKVNTKNAPVLENVTLKNFNVSYYQDLVINGLGFIKITQKCNIDIYVQGNVEVFLRNSLI